MRPHLIPAAVVAVVLALGFVAIPALAADPATTATVQEENTRAFLDTMRQRNSALVRRQVTASSYGAQQETYAPGQHPAQLQNTEERRDQQNDRVRIMLKSFRVQ
ncbi:MAG: hypothetical protein KQJ78_21000 [Deltaproteobacteria bacterium]|nr:hypothetical protein [Deltaproteobacteria bacterium]